MTLQELNRGHKLHEQLKERREILDTLRAKATAPRVSHLDGVPHSGGHTDGVGYMAAAIVDMEKDVERLERELDREKQKVSAFIETVPDSKLRTVFTLRFLSMLQWKEIPGVIGCYSTYDTVRSMVYRYLRKTR